jgi:hypothetical protein
VERGEKEGLQTSSCRQDQLQLVRRPKDKSCEQDYSHTGPITVRQEAFKLVLQTGPITVSQEAYRPVLNIHIQDQLQYS